MNDSISIVLVEPQNPGNIGMVCRAMKNMGLNKLRLVNPCQVDHPEAYKFAVSAKDVLLDAKIYNSLEVALADIELSVATTRRHGKYRQEIFNPEEISNLIKSNIINNKAAIVFGREDSGLTTDEVALCRWHATIQTSKAYGSMNLAQSVLIFCYEFSKCSSNTQICQERKLADTLQHEELFRHMEMTLLSIGFLNPGNPEHLMRSLRRVFARANLDEREVAIFRGIMSQIDWAAAQFKGKKRSCR